MQPAIVFILLLIIIVMLISITWLLSYRESLYPKAGGKKVPGKCILGTKIVPSSCDVKVPIRSKQSLTIHPYAT